MRENLYSKRKKEMRWINSRPTKLKWQIALLFDGHKRQYVCLIWNESKIVVRPVWFNLNYFCLISFAAWHSNRVEINWARISQAKAKKKKMINQNLRSKLLKLLFSFHFKCSQARKKEKRNSFIDATSSKISLCTRFSWITSNFTK